MLSNKSLKCALLLGVILGSWAILSAWSISDQYHGNRYGAFDPRGFAMGSSGTYSDASPFAIATNPANIFLLKSRFGAQGSLNYTRNEDNRAVPLYNSFDNYVDDAVYSSNINAYDDYSGMIFGTLGNGMLHTGLGLYFKPLLSFDGDYNEQIRNNYGTDNDIYPEIIAMNQIRNEGTIDQMGIAYSFGFDAGNNMGIGFGVDYSLLTGSFDSRKSILWTDVAKSTVAAINTNFLLPDYIESTKADFDGSMLKFGSTIKINSHFGIGFTYTSEATLEETGTFDIMRTKSTLVDSLSSSADIDRDFIIPSEIRIGFSYRPQNIMHTWFNLDVEQVKWTDLHEAYDDVINIYAGVEHHIENRYPLRLGFQAVNSWMYNVETDLVEGELVDVLITKKVLTPMITAGSSIALAKNIKFDLGFGYAWREYEALDMFGDTYYNDKIHTGHSTALLWRNPQYLSFVDRGWENPDKVRESFITLSTGLSFTW